jgi:WD40 repeat protein
MKVASEVSDLKASPDGKALCVTCDKTLYLFDVQSGAIKAAKVLDREIKGIKYSYDGNKIAVACDGNTIAVFEPKNLTKVTSFSAPQEFYPTGFASLDWSEDGTFIVAGHYESCVTVFDSKSGTVLKLLETDWPSLWPTKVIFLDSRTCIANAYDRVFIWKLPEISGNWKQIKKRILRLSTKEVHIKDLVLSPDKTKLAILWEGEDNSCGFEVISLVSGKKVGGRQLSEYALRMCYLPGKVIIGEYNGVRAWDDDRSTQEPSSFAKSFEGSEKYGSFAAVSLDPTMKYLFAGSEAGNVLYWHADTGQLLSR